ncbi:MAG TPA: SusC/RagA family TonB-linked outer membrane protein [Puia sp.]|nr:SusC/RagA family TonB-linked outer membrane protein [Puia sp.]
MLFSNRGKAPLWPHMWKVVKLTVFFLTIGLLHAYASGNAQQVTYSGKDIPLATVFSAIEKQTGYVFFYRTEDLSAAKPVTVAFRNTKLADALDACFHGQPLNFVIRNKTVFVTAAEPTTVPSSETTNALATDTAVLPSGLRGRVTDSLGAPLQGANVLLKGTARGTTTDTAGYFELSPVRAGAVIVVSYSGLETQEIKVRVRSSLAITLSHKYSPLDEVQVIAYGTTTKRLNTGDVSTVSSKTVGDQPVADPLAALEGRVPGLIVTQTNGLPGAAFNVQIRGQNSLINGNDPLYIVDGVPFGFANADLQLSGGAVGNQSPFRVINPGDIESIEVLKDADATAIYGSRGANGVILITTRKGRAGKLKLDLNVNTGFGQVGKEVKYLNLQQYLAMRHEAFANDGATPDPAVDYDLLAWDTTRYTNWQNVFSSNSSRYDDDEIGLSGGTAQLQWLLGGNYHRETTVLPSSLANYRNGVRLNIFSTSLDKRFTLSASANYSNVQLNLPVADLFGAANLPPDAPYPVDASGNLVWSENGGSYENPFAYLRQKYNGNTKNLLSSLLLNYHLLHGLDVRLNAGYTETHVLQTSEFPLSSQNPAYNPVARANYDQAGYTSWTLEPQLSYNDTIGGLKLALLLGATFQQDLNQGNSVIASNFTSDALLANLGAAANVSTASYYDLYRYDAAFARATANWENKYILNLTSRRDGSSRFGPGRQFADFGAVGAAWIFSEDRFFKRMPVLSYGKLRASYGSTGNDRIGNYNYLDTYSADYGTYNGVSGLAPTRLFNPDYAWEANRKAEAGIELGFFRDRLVLMASYFNNRSSNQLLQYALPSQTGFTSVLENFPALIENRGWEFTLTTANIRTRHFTWTTTANLTAASNKLVAFPGLDSSSYAYTYVVGQPLSLMRVFHYKGIDPATGLYSFTGTDWPTDLTDYKDIIVNYYGGINNHFSLNSWQLDLFFQFVKQNGRNYIASSGHNPGTPYNQPSDVLKRWQRAGDNTDVQRFSQDYNGFQSYVNYAYYSGGPVTDASFIRLKNVALSYSFPASVTRRLCASSLRVYATAQNLLTITGYRGGDPETQSLSTMPPLRVITGGLQITF